MNKKFLLIILFCLISIQMVMADMFLEAGTGNYNGNGGGPVISANIDLADIAKLKNIPTSNVSGLSNDTPNMIMNFGDVRSSSSDYYYLIKVSPVNAAGFSFVHESNAAVTVPYSIYIYDLDNKLKTTASGNVQASVGRDNYGYTKNNSTYFRFFKLHLKFDDDTSGIIPGNYSTQFNVYYEIYSRSWSPWGGYSYNLEDSYSYTIGLNAHYETDAISGAGYNLTITRDSNADRLQIVNDSNRSIVTTERKLGSISFTTTPISNPSKTGNDDSPIKLYISASMQKDSNAQFVLRRRESLSGNIVSDTSNTVAASIKVTNTNRSSTNSGFITKGYYEFPLVHKLVFSSHIWMNDGAIAIKLSGTNGKDLISGLYVMPIYFIIESSV